MKVWVLKQCYQDSQDVVAVIEDSPYLLDIASVSIKENLSHLSVNKIEFKTRENGCCNCIAHLDGESPPNKFYFEMILMDVKSY